MDDVDSVNYSRPIGRSSVADLVMDAPRELIQRWCQNGGKIVGEDHTAAGLWRGS